VRAAFALGQISNDEDLPRDGVIAALKHAARSTGLDDHEIEATILSGFNKGFEAPRPTTAAVSSDLYVPLDLKLWFDSDHAPPEHFGRGEVLYKEGLTWLSGEPESGKSFIALAWALDVVRSGKAVVWLDEEAGPRDTLSKLKVLGATPDELQGLFIYLQPQARDLSKTSKQFVNLVRKMDCGLVVIDSAAAILANAGVDEDKNSQVTGLINKAILPLSKELGVATVVIDHKSKSNTESRYSRGASAKLGIVDLALNVAATQPFSRGVSGAIEVRVMKDRWGDFGRNAIWRIDAAAGDPNLELNFQPLMRAGNPVKRVSNAEQDLEERVQRVRTIVQSAQPLSLSREAIVKQLTGVGTTKSREAIDAALGSGIIRHGSQVSGGQALITLSDLPVELF
jgi:hypothetical protein